MKTDLVSAWEEITPAKATKYLEGMDRNRSVRQAIVDFYAAQMKAGLWRPTHQGIAFDKDGHMVDGQHRCWAVIESETPIRVMVTRGLSAEDVVALDTTLGRDYRDHAHYAGWEPTSGLCGSMARALVLGMHVTTRIPAQVQHQWYEFYKEGIDFGLRLRNHSSPSAGKLITMPMAAAFARAFYSVDSSVLARFGEIMKTGQYAVEADRAAFVLREGWLQKRLGNRGDQYGKTASAIRAFAKRRVIRKLQQSLEDVFAIPKLPRELQYKTFEHHHHATEDLARRRSKQKERVKKEIEQTNKVNAVANGKEKAKA